MDSPAATSITPRPPSEVLALAGSSPSPAGWPLHAATSTAAISAVARTARLTISTPGTRGAVDMSAGDYEARGRPKGSSSCQVDRNASAA